MLTKDFFEDYPLYRKLDFEVDYYQSRILNIPKPAINMYCPQCKSIQTFNMENEYDELVERSTLIWNNIFRSFYECSACHKSYYLFFIEFQLIDKIEKQVDGGVQNLFQGFVRKVGQTPRWEIIKDPALLELLGKHTDFYTKGLVNESENYGIGAYAYFRRITEDVISDLLSSIEELIEEKDREKYTKALEKVKVSHIAEEKIDLVKDLLPSSLKINGINPLKILHSALSEGIHNKTEEECLALAETIEETLIYLLHQIKNKKEESKRFTGLLEKLQKKAGKS